MLKAINIKWDTDGDMEVLNELPMEMIIPDKLEEMYKKDKEYALDEISDWLSDETGFCHDGFEIEKELTKEDLKEWQVKIMKEKFWQYILDNFTIDNDGRKMICNILDWIWLQSMDKEDTVNALLLLLDGIGIEKEEIEQFVNWDQKRTINGRMEENIWTM